MVFTVMVKNQNMANTPKNPLMIANSDPINVGSEGAKGSTTTWPKIITSACRERSLVFWAAALIV
ncbi:hypothetical protein ALQ26_200049 [Pseudomonas amygdali pv. lachrymans]|nr:hypothetical protein ALQ26_200049 [Pseudomonas amygdali pv. lachrymans]RMU28060.1 hypothetical protein ALP31_200185 [Pseudomonas amygdali pv. morsprunorum]